MVKINQKKSLALVDIAIRSSTIIARGAFVFISAKYLDDRDFGLYIAIVANISLMQYVVAGDYSYIAHREFFAGRINFEKILITQPVLLGFLFSLSCVILFYLLPKEIDSSLIIIILMILFFESVASELQRHLVAISKFTISNLVLFFKSAGWMLPLMGIFALQDDLRSIWAILVAWSVGLLLSVAIGLYEINFVGAIREKVNYLLLKKYIKTVPTILIGTLATRSMFSLDRVILEKTNGLEVVGAYGLYVGIASAFVAIIDAGVLMRAYPSLVKYGRLNHDDYNKLSKKIQLQVAIATLIGIALYELTVNSVLRIVSKQSYLEYSHIGALLILAYGIYSLSFPLNCRLYSCEADKSITLINVIALLPILFVLLLDGITMNDLACAIVMCALMHYVLRWLLIRSASFGK